MKIGIFDSGLGGLIVAKSIVKSMPKYDYAYLGDTLRVPYGNRPEEEIFKFARDGVRYLFQKENCAIVIVACNTVSARALRRLQREFVPKRFPGRKVLGVLIPAAEECKNFKNIGVIGTVGTIKSGTFPKEIKKINKKAKVFQSPAPMLVLLAEEGRRKPAYSYIEKYLEPFASKNLDALVLGCTHYPIFKREIKKIVGNKVKIISQDEIVPKKLKKYLTRHPEISKKLSQKGKTKILVTKITPHIKILSQKWFGKGKKAKPRLVEI